MFSPAAANIQALIAASTAFPGFPAAGILAMGSPFVNLGLSPTGHLPMVTKLATNALSPPAGATPPSRNEGSIIDFSNKRKDATEPTVIADKCATPRGRTAGETGPLDLSTVRKRPRGSTIGGGDAKNAGPAEKKRSSGGADSGGVGSSSWPASLIASGLLKASDVASWNGNAKSDSKANFETPPDASKALERMTELSRLTERSAASTVSSSSSTVASAASGGGRQSAWQSHWLSKGADTAKDVLKCVWCKQSFESLAALTTHMKESKHCGVNASVVHSGSSVTSVPTQSPPITASHPQQSPHGNNNNNNNSSGRASVSTPNETNSAFLKETVQLPRKLVRGQDVWLGKGAEQTRQILKCMWCGQSFRSLAEMTTHMQQTQHYTNIISQEQIISWKAADDKTSQNHVNAVLTCKVCDQAFSSLKELSSHMVKNSHYKEHIMRSISESGGRRRQARDKRKKALPVRKLLELERAQQEQRSRDSLPAPPPPAMTPAALVGLQNPARITCEKCGDKIETNIFVEHIRLCVGNNRTNNKTPNAPTPASTPTAPSAPDKKQESNGVSIKAAKNIAEEAKSHKTPTPSPSSASQNDTATSTEGSPSVLNAIEKLIEKSFDTQTKRGANVVGSNILRRLGIDESVDYTKPLIDPATVNMLRLYGYHRERSTSEASSASERVSHGDTMHPLNGEYLQRADSGKSTPRSKFDSRATSEEGNEDSIKIKRETSEDEDDDVDDDEDSRSMLSPHDDIHDMTKVEAVVAAANNVANSPLSPSTVSERSLRSGTPASSLDRKASCTPEDLVQRRSQTHTPETRSHSLTALSSMFEGLSSSANANNTQATSSTGGASSANPLAALQKLCDKTETSHTPAKPASLVDNATPSSAGPGAILAFSWACNDAIMTDSIMKCAFCDTQFISKGAYRYHLSKVHFVKDPLPTKGSQPPPASKSAALSPPQTSGAANFEESPHSKFLKYSELAKQLSSKYV